jgi:hypothetical protein
MFHDLTGYHFPGARGSIHAGPQRSPLAINCSIAALLAARAVLISVMASSQSLE